MCACVRAFARICGGVYTGRGTTEREREREREREQTRACYALAQLQAERTATVNETA